MEVPYDEWPPIIRLLLKSIDECYEKLSQELEA